MKAQNNFSRSLSSQEDSPVSKNSPVTVHAFRNLKQDKEFDELLAQHHYLGACPPVGDFLRQWVFVKGELVALLAWGASCYQLKSRDEHIGWDKRRATERLKLIVQNHRYLLLTPKGQAPNLASQILGAVVKALPEQWEKAFGYRPLAAESFSDIEAYAGTAYKAAGWTHLGDTMGYSRKRKDFFAKNGHPKKVWFKPLALDALDQLKAPTPSGKAKDGSDTNAHGVLPLSIPQRESLYDFLRSFPDPRASNCSYRIHSMLCLLVMGMLSGRRDVSALLRFAQSLTQAQRAELGLPFKKGTRFRKVPGYRAIRNLLESLEPDILARELNKWLATQNGRLPSAIAVDGKMVKTVAGVVSLVDAQTGSPIAMRPMRHKESGPDGEATSARNALEDAGDLQGQTLTGDALQTNREFVTQVLDQGGEYLLQIKGNQETLYKEAKARTKTSPFLP